MLMVRWLSRNPEKQQLSLAHQRTKECRFSSVIYADGADVYRITPKSRLQPLLVTRTLHNSGVNRSSGRSQCRLQLR